MGWQCSWYPQCDGCGVDGPSDRRSADAEDAALAAGWAKGRYGGIALFLCPACVAKGLPVWWPVAPAGFSWRELREA